MLNVISYKTLNDNPDISVFDYLGILYSKIDPMKPSDIKFALIEQGAIFLGEVPIKSNIEEMTRLAVESVGDTPALSFKFNNIEFMVYATGRIAFCHIKKLRSVKYLFARIRHKYRNTNIPPVVSSKTKFEKIKEYINSMYLNQSTIDQIVESIKPFVSTYDRRRRYGLNMNLSIILTGEPGDGKTYSATKIIEFIGSLLSIVIVREEGNTFKLSGVTNDFAALLDDMNVSHFQRSGANANPMVCQKILSEMDQTGTNRLFILTTNEQISRDNIDKAFFRPGRVQNIITVNRPNTAVKHRIIDDIVEKLLVKDGMALENNFIIGMKLLTEEATLSLAEMMRLRNLILMDVIMGDPLKNPRDYINNCKAVEVPESVLQEDSETVNFE